MSETFANAPLVEIVVELRWQQRNVAVQDQAPKNHFGVPLSLIDGGASHDDFFMRFGGIVYGLGYVQSERLVPPGFPLMPHQAARRFRKKDGSEVFQVGPGLFTANCVPPYKSWNEFAPEVASGIGALLEARGEADRALPFTSVTLRYIDAFTTSQMVGTTPQLFMRNVLGFSVELPGAITTHLAQGSDPAVALQLAMPLVGGMTLQLQLAEASVNKQDSLLMDTTVACAAPVTPTRVDLLAALTSAHDVIHDIFVNMTLPIREVLEPQGS